MSDRTEPRRITTACSGRAPNDSFILHVTSAPLMPGVRRLQGEAIMGDRKRNLSRASRLFVGLFILASCAQNHAQPRDQSAPAVPIIKAAPDETFCPFYFITVEVKVTDPHREEASSLGADDFTVYDNGVEQQVSMWARLEGSGKENEEAVYALAYAPANLYDGKFHRIRVVARGKNKRKLKAKLLSPEGYDAREYLRSQQSTPPNNGWLRPGRF